MQKKLSFVIPCYRSSATIMQVVNDIITTVTANNNYTYEIILVNDCSPDDNATWQCLRCLAEENPAVKAINFSKNSGQHAALLAGYRYATGSYVISLDDDGQTDPRFCFDLIAKLEQEDLDIVFAAYPEKQHAWYRNIGTLLNNTMASYLIGRPKSLSLTSYFVCRSFIIEELCRYQGPFPYIDGLLLRSSSRIGSVSVPHHTRQEGSSGYTFSKLLGLWLNGFTAFSIKPLRIATLAGFACACFGFLFGLYVIIQRFVITDYVAGYSSLMAVIIFVGGMLMIMLGLVGEYIGRIYISINNSPQYVVRETVNTETTDNTQFR
ncbi:MAG: glycosyltransferase [Oscillospiraceae bacterium]|nr:glycosyltransferase [Oscillospiraceae bacterium]